MRCSRMRGCRASTLHRRAQTTKTHILATPRPRSRSPPAKGCVRSTVDRELDLLAATCNLAIKTWRIPVDPKPDGRGKRPRSTSRRRNNCQLRHDRGRGSRTDAELIRVSSLDARAIPSGYTPYSDTGDSMTAQQRPGRARAEPDALERELDSALEDTFPASDPIAIDSTDVHEERRRKAQQDSRRSPGETEK